MLYAAEPLASDSEDEKQESKSLRNENKAGNVRPQNKNFFEHPKNTLPELKSTLQVALNHVGKLSPPTLHRSKANMFSLLKARTLCPRMQIRKYPLCCVEQFSQQHKQYPKHQFVR